MEPLSNLNVVSQEPLPTPAAIHEELAGTPSAGAAVLAGRQALRAILRGEDKRRFVVVGPCSIHDVKAAMEYAERLRTLAAEVEDQLLVIMRVYFEKPRTTVGWKGLINDPFMDDSFRIEEGIRMARGLLLSIAELGLPTGTEALDPIMPQYLSDLISWTAIGARTTESQTHREMASGLSTPVGFKNATDGNVVVAVNAMKSAAQPHSFLGLNNEGLSAVTRTRGNAYGHIVLRGGNQGPNYDANHVKACEQTLRDQNAAERIVIDCSHANSNKQPERQPVVLADCLSQFAAGNRSIVGFMIESHLHGGNQVIPPDLKDLAYGVSVTDACVDWETTEEMIKGAHAKLKRLATKK